MKEENQTGIKGPMGVKGPEGPLMPRIIFVPVETTASGKDYSTHLILILGLVIGFIIGALAK